jgi:hypothetical protein
MGIARGAAKMILEECKRRPFEGSVLTLGRQDMYFTYSMLESWAAEFEVTLQEPPTISLSHNKELAKKGFVSDETFFQALGFSEVASLDHSDFEGATYLFDLNSQTIDEKLQARFDVIINGGTIEHVFHIPNVLQNIYAMLKDNGRICHGAPSSNHIDHGFYMFSPTLFWDYYTANRFDINTFHLFRYTETWNEEPWEISRYLPGSLQGVSMGGLDDAMYGIWMIATKTEESRYDVIPQQGAYVVAWTGSQFAEAFPNQSASVAPQTVAFSVSEPPWKTKVKSVIRRSPMLYDILRSLKHRIVRPPHSYSPTNPANPPAKKTLGLEVIAHY